MFASGIDKCALGVRERRVSEVPGCHSKSHILVALSRSQFPDFPDSVKFGLCTLNLCFSFLYISLWSILPEATMRGPVKIIYKQPEDLASFLSTCCICIGFTGRVNGFLSHLGKWLSKTGMRPQLERTRSGPSPAAGTQRSYGSRSHCKEPCGKFWQRINGLEEESRHDLCWEKREAWERI